MRTIGGVFGGAEAIPVVETTTRSLRNVPKGKELVHQLPKKEGRIRKIRSFGHGQDAVQDNLCVTALAIYLGGVFGVVHSEQVRGCVSLVATTWLASVALSRAALACAWSV